MSNKNHRRLNSNTVVRTMTLKDFLELAPQFKESFPDDFDFDDDNYIVKMNADFSRIEIGYAEDKWFMKG